MNRLLPIVLMALTAFVASGCVGAGSYYGGGYAYDPYWPFRHYYYPYFHHFRMPWPRYYPYPLRPWSGYRRPYGRFPGQPPWASYRSDDWRPGLGLPGRSGDWHRRGAGQPHWRRGSAGGGSGTARTIETSRPRNDGHRPRRGGSGGGHRSRRP
jgi:hypothetical protein